MTTYNCGEVILVRFIFSDNRESKLRPALILSTQSYHNKRQELIMAAITSNLDHQLIGDTKIKDWKKAGLLHPSLVSAIIRTIKQEMIRHKLGRLTNNDFQKVKQNLKKVLGI